MLSYYLSFLLALLGSGVTGMFVYFATSDSDWGFAATLALITLVFAISSASNKNLGTIRDAAIRK